MTNDHSQGGDIPGDRRSEGQRDHDRFLAVFTRVVEVIQAVTTVRGQGAA